LLDLVQNDYVVVEIMKVMFGLPQSSILAYEKLFTHLAKHGYAPCQRTMGLWKHVPRDVTLYLAGKDFVVKYMDEDYSNHPINALCELYKDTTDWMGL
jgi:hypothetical protein